MKPITALNHHQGEIFRPADCQYLNYEGEFAAIIGRETRDITPEEAWDHIAGFAPALDMGIHDFRDTDSGLCCVSREATACARSGQGLFQVSTLESKH